MRVFLVDIEFPYIDGKYDKTSIVEKLDEIRVPTRHTVDASYRAEFLVDETQMVDICVMGIRFKIVQQTQVFSDNIEISHRMSAIAARLDEIASGYGASNWDGSDMFNSKCNLHQPGVLLSHYNETLLLEDCCTDYLQASLDKGWRIVVACPQPNSRRADYVMARYNPAPALDGRAARDH